MKQNPHLPGTPDEFITANMKLAQSLAWDFIKVNNPSEQDDILSVAYLGLIKAYEQYDPTRSEDVEFVKFSTYAVPTIKGYIFHYLRENQSSLRIGRPIIRLTNKVRKIGITGYEPLEEIAAKANITLAEAKKVVKAIPALNVDSLDRPVNDRGEANTVGYYIGSDEDFIDQIILRDFISTLTPQQKRIYQLRMVEGRSQAQTGKIMGLSQMWVCRLEKKLLKAAREYGSYPELKRSV